MADVRKEFSGAAPETALSSSITDSSSSFTVDDAAGHPDGSSGNPFVETLGLETSNEEKVLCESRSGNTFTVAAGGRGYDGTVAVSHQENESVHHTIDAVLVDAANEHHTDSAATAHAASKVSNTPAGSIAATDVQAAIDELDGDLTAHEGGADPHSGAYVAAGQPITLGVAGLDPAAATSPARSQTSAASFWDVWGLDSATDEAVGGSFRIPAGWTSIDIDVLVNNNGAGSGDYVTRTIYDGVVDGDTLAQTAEANVTTTALARDVVDTVRLASAVAVTAGQLFRVVVQRMGTDAADTLANDIGVLAIVISKAA